MRFTAPKDLVKKSITYLYSVTNESLILMGANLESKRVTIESASNGIYVRTWHKLDVEAKGIVAVDGQHIASIRYPTDVTFEEVKAEAGSRVRIKSGNFRAEVATLPNGGYVKMQRPADVDSPVLVIPKDVLARAVDATVFAKPIKESATDGIALTFDAGWLHMYAFDGIRASMYKVQIDGLPADVTTHMVLSSKFFDALKRLPGTDSALQVTNAAGGIRVQTDAALLAYPTLLATPHNVPQSVAGLRDGTALGKFAISSSVLSNTLDTVCSIVRGGAGHKDALTFDVQAGKLRLTMQSTDGDAFDDTALEGDVQPCTFKLGAKHIQEIAGMVSGDVTITLYDGSIVLDSDAGRSTIVLAVLA